MTAPASAVQKAVFEALVPAVAPVLVHDHAPQDAAFPFVEFAGAFQRPWDTFETAGGEHTLYLTVWSTYRGQKEVLDILDKIRAALHRARLPLDTGRMILCDVTDARSLRDADGVTYQGAATLRILTL